MRDLKDNVKVLVAVAPQALSSTTDIVGEIIDLQGFDSCMFAVMTDGIAASSLAGQLLIEESDLSTMSDATAVADANLVGLESDTAFTQATTKASNLKVGYIGTKRYVRATIDLSANNGTDVMGAMCVLGHPMVKPN